MALGKRLLELLGEESAIFLTQEKAEPSPATHAILTVLKAGETVHLLRRVHKTLSAPGAAFGH